MDDRSEHPLRRVARWLWDRILEPAYLKFLEQPTWFKAPLYALLLAQAVPELLGGTSLGDLLAAVIEDLRADAALRRSLVE